MSTNKHSEDDTTNQIGSLVDPQIGSDDDTEYLFNVPYEGHDEGRNKGDDPNTKVEFDDEGDLIPTLMPNREGDESDDESDDPYTMDTSDDEGDLTGLEDDGSTPRQEGKHRRSKQGGAEGGEGGQAQKRLPFGSRSVKAQHGNAKRRRETGGAGGGAQTRLDFGSNPQRPPAAPTFGPTAHGQSLQAMSPPPTMAAVEQLADLPLSERPAVPSRPAQERRCPSCARLDEQRYDNHMLSRNDNKGNECNKDDTTAGVPSPPASQPCTSCPGERGKRARLNTGDKQEK